MNARTLANLAAFQLVWWACVLGAAKGWPWLGVLALAASVALHLFYTVSPRRELLLLGAAGAMGLAVEWALHAGAVIGYPPQAWTGAPAPAWMVALWVNFATTLHVSLAWLRGRFTAASVAGAFAGPLSYWGGERLGGITLYPEPAVWIGAIGLAWAVATPLLVWIAEATE